MQIEAVMLHHETVLKKAGSGIMPEQKTGIEIVEEKTGLLLEL